MKVSHFFGDGLYAKESHIPAGYRVGKHVHHYTHLSILAQGSVRLTAGDTTSVLHAPHCLEVKAGVSHEFEAITEAVWYCIHQVDEKGLNPQSPIDEILITKGT